MDIRAAIYDHTKRITLTGFLALVLFVIAMGSAIAETTLTVVANAYTPEMSSGDNPNPLHEFSRIAREWERLHPGVKVQFIKMPTGDYHTWLLTQLKGGMAPDLVWAHSYWSNEDAKYGYFLPFDEYLSAPNPYIPGNRQWLDVFYKDAVESKRADDGHIYSLPIDMVGAGFYYNKDIFRKVGVKAPETWAELMTASKKIKKAGYVPFLCTGGTFGSAITLMRAAINDQLWDDMIPKIHVTKDRIPGYQKVSPQEFVRAYKKRIWSIRDPRYLEELRIVKEFARYWNEDALASGSGDRLFRVGKAAMYLDGSWYAPALQRDKLRKFDFGVFLMPRLTKETSEFATGLPMRDLGGPYSVQFAVTSEAAKAGKKELAMDFLQYTTIPKNLGPLVAEAGMFLPNSPGLKGSPVLDPFVESLKQGELRFNGEPSMSQYNQEHFRTIQSYIGGEFSLEQTLSLLDGFLEKAVNRLIRDNPQWRFSKTWEILPDGPKKPISTEATAPDIVRYIPWLILAAAVGAIFVSFIRNGKEIFKQIRKKKSAYLFIVPTLFMIAVFCYYPIISAFYHSLFEWKGGGEASWVGIANFRELLGDQLLADSAVRMLKLMLFGIIISLTIPFAAAELVFHLASKRMQYFYRVLFVIPMVVPGIVSLLIWGFIYDYNIGVVNGLMRAIGLEAYVQAWLGNPKIALYSLMFVGFPWIGGFSLLIYYAGLQGIPTSVLESCKLDGASVWERIRYVDIPLVMGQTKLLVILGFIGGLQGFQTQLILTQGGPGYATTVPGLHLYQNAMAYDRMGYACALGVVLFVVILGLTYLNTKYLKSSNEYGQD